jgi:hypothetical protein
MGVEKKEKGIFATYLQQILLICKTQSIDDRTLQANQWHKITIQLVGHSKSNKSLSTTTTTSVSFLSKNIDDLITKIHHHTALTQSIKKIQTLADTLSLAAEYSPVTLS